MKKILEFLKNWFEKNGLLKIICSVVLLVLITWLFNATDWKFLKYVIWIPAGYLIITFLLFLAAGIINTINDYRKK